MMDKIIIKILKLFPGLFSRQGVNVYQLFDIVETKLMMDKRRVHFQFRRHDQNKNEMQTGLPMFFYFMVFLVFSWL